MDLDQHLVILRDGLVDLPEIEDFGRTVSRAHDGFHDRPPGPSVKTAFLRSASIPMAPPS
jgi:hypothetical protein